EGASALVTSAGGPVSVGGKGGPSGDYCTGVRVANSGTITAGGGGAVTVVGIGGLSTGHNNYGVECNEGNISSGGGNVFVSGQGGGNSAVSSFSNLGVFI